MTFNCKRGSLEEEEETDVVCMNRKVASAVVPINLKQISMYKGSKLKKGLHCCISQNNLVAFTGMDLMKINLHCSSCTNYYVFSLANVNKCVYIVSGSTATIYLHHSSVCLQLP